MKNRTFQLKKNYIKKSEMKILELKKKKITKIKNSIDVLNGKWRGPGKESVNLKTIEISHSKQWSKNTLKEMTSVSETH